MNLERMVASQRIKIEELEEEIRQIKEGMTVKAAFYPLDWGLTPAQTRILFSFSKNRFLTHEQCFDALALNGCADPGNLVKVQINKLRKKIGPLGMEVINRWGEGYEMPEASVAKLAASLRVQA